MLHAAIGKNDWKEVQKLLNISYINVNERDRILQTPLHAVCTSGHKQLAEILLQKGADVNAVDTNNWAPIHCAAANCQLELVDLLLDQRKTNLAILSKDGTSMFHYLMRNRVDSSQEDLYLKVLDKSKSKGADITLHGKHLETPMHQAALRSNICAIRYLLDNGANIDAQNKFGETALHYAVRTKDKELIKYLIERNADMSIRSRDGLPIDIADDDIKCILQGDYNDIQAPAMPAPTPAEVIQRDNSLEKSLEGKTSGANGNVDQRLLQVQQHMLTQYTNQAYQNGRPTSLPIFCTNCLKPFTYPIGAIFIKCPMCLTVNQIPKN